MRHSVGSQTHIYHSDKLWLKCAHSTPFPRHKSSNKSYNSVMGSVSEHSPDSSVSAPPRSINKKCMFSEFPNMSKC